MLILLFILIVLYGCFSKNNNKYWLICALLLSVLVNTSSFYADFQGYNYIYDYVNEGRFGQNFISGGPYLWYTLCFIFGRIGLSYRGMIIILIFVSMFLINYRIKKFKINTNLFWALFIIFPGIIQCVQLRFFFGTSIVFSGLIPFLNNEKGSLVKFLICVFISYFVHSSCLIFLIFLSFLLFKKYGYKKIFVISIGIFLIMFFTLQKFIPSIVINFISSNKFDRYFGSSSSSFSSLRFVKILFMWSICHFIGMFILNKINKNLKDDEVTLNFSNNVQKTITFFIITLFFLVFDGNFHRFIEIAYMFFYINLSFYRNYIKMNRVSYFCFIIIVLSIASLAIISYAPSETVLKPLFRYDGFNSIFR